MRIGIDIDNVISNFNEELLKAYLEHDKSLRNTGIINRNSGYIRKGMFDWSEQEEQKFYLENIERIAKNLSVKEDAKKYLDKLRSDGHFICIITGRDNKEYKNPFEMTEKWLAENKIYYDKIIFTNAYLKDEKAQKCLENNIDIMIDDSVSNCKHCLAQNITTFLMDTPYNKYADIPRVHNWQEFYNEINKILEEQ